MGMNSAEPLSFVDETSNLVVVRIDAQEKEFVDPIREYLETNGCRVYVNQKPPDLVAYHIATGDTSFVKSIFSANAHPKRSRLGIVMKPGHHDVQDDLQNLCKIVVVDPVMLAPSDVVDIFSFFFAGNSIIIDKRRNIHEPSFAPIKIGATGGRPAFPNQLKTSSVAPKPQNVPAPNDQERIGHIMSDVFPKKGNEASLTGSKKITRHRRRKIKIRIWIALLFFFFIFVVPNLWYGISIATSAASFALGARELQQSNVSGATRAISVGDYWLHQAKFSFGFVGLPFRVVGYTSSVRGQERFLSFLSDISSALRDITVIARNGKEVATLLLTSYTSDTRGTPAHAVEQLHMSVVSVSEKLGLAKAELTTLVRDRTFPFSVSPVVALGERMLASLEKVRGTLTYVDELLTVYPHFAGFSEPKTYLVLLQNSNELRPTGGFIGSVGLVQFENGTLSDFSIQDVYALDGQLKGHVDPPLPIRDVLGQEHWYLRDSNWDPDFTRSAARAAWFYQKEGGEPVDGVIAINSSVVVDILGATGPILLPDYNDQISKDNFFGKSFYYTQNDFFPGSTQKSDFLGSLARALLTKITTEKNVNPIGIFRAVSDGLMRKDILFMFTDTNLQQLVEYFGWGGRVLKNQGCDGVEQEYCFFDPLIAVEANMSVSKVNYFVKRSAVREININPDATMTESYSLTLRNTFEDASSQSAKGIGGSYISYVRFFVSEDVSVQDVTLDGVPIRTRSPKAVGVPRIPYIENIQEAAGVRVIGVAMEVPPGTKHTIRISFSRLHPISFGRGGATIDLFYYKHPGISDETVGTIVRYPIYWSIVPEQNGQAFLAKEGQLEYNSTILQDQIIRLRIIK
jgi:hypothetical protein